MHNLQRHVGRYTSYKMSEMKIKQMTLYMKNWPFLNSSQLLNKSPASMNPKVRHRVYKGQLLVPALGYSVASYLSGSFVKNHFYHYPPNLLP